MDKKIIEKIYNMLCSQKFYDWHQTGAFCRHIENDTPSKEEIFKNIEDFLQKRR